MFTLSSIYLFTAFLVVLGLLIYYLIYTAKINKRIRSGEVSGKKLVDIPRIIMIFVIAVLGFYCFVLWYYLHNADGTSRNDYVIISVDGQDENECYAYGGNLGLDDASFAGVYSKESNAGYNKEVIKDGDYIFTIFKRISKADNFHPDFLCYAEYKGKNKESITVYNTASFVSVSDVDDPWNSGYNGYGISDCLLFIGNMQVGVDFHIRFDLMDEAAEASFTDAKQKNPEEEDNSNSPNPADFATSSAEVTISFD